MAGGGGGGAWKVAAADFFTAMMALFMVLWILGSEQELLEELQEYFRNPPSPFTQRSGKFVIETGHSSGRSGEDWNESFFNRVDPAILKAIVNEFNKILQMEASEDKVPAVDIVITSDGLRVSVFDRENTPLFKANHTQLTPWANFVVQNLAWLIARYPFEIIVESYTSEMPAEGIDGMHRGDTAWELSSRRGNIFRQRLQFYANEQLNFRSVVGYGSNASFTEEEITRGKTNQHIALSLSLSNAQRPLNFTEALEDLPKPTFQSTISPPEEANRP